MLKHPVLRRERRGEAELAVNHEQPAGRDRRGGEGAVGRRRRHRHDAGDAEVAVERAVGHVLDANSQALFGRFRLEWAPVA